METKYLESRQAHWAMYLATYDFDIIYRRGTSNPADGPSRRPDYEEGSVNVTWLPTFQNKLKGAFAVAIQRSLGISGESPLFAISAMAKETILLRDKQIDHRVDYSTKDSVENQGVGRCLEGPASEAKVMEVSTTTSPKGIMNSSVPRVFELDGCKYLIPRTWIYAATERATALAPLSEPLLDIVKVAQRNDSRCQNIVKQRLGKRDTEGSRIWSNDSGLLRYHSRIIVPDDPALR